MRTIVKPEAIQRLTTAQTRRRAAQKQKEKQEELQALNDDALEEAYQAQLEAVLRSPVVTQPCKGRLYTFGFGAETIS